MRKTAIYLMEAKNISFRYLSICFENALKIVSRVSVRKGAFNGYVDKILDIFDHPPTPRRQGKLIKKDNLS